MSIYMAVLQEFAACVQIPCRAGKVQHQIFLLMWSIERAGML
jgi:hypothetical protein